MKWKFKELQGRVQAHTGHSVTYDEIMEATGLARQTVASISTGTAKRLDLGTMESVLTFFSARLGEELTTNDLLEYRPGP
jgi:DNA-binding Xre family transcriptional regulator